MTPTLAPPPTPLEAATSAWRLANWRERSHANRCGKLLRGVRCVTCLDLEAATNRAADRVAQARRTAVAS